MESSSDAVATLARLYLQTLGLSLLFAGTGRFIYRKLFPAPSAEGPSLRWSRGYFLGLSAFLPVFVFLSRMIGAGAALWLAVVLMGGMSLLEVAASRRARLSTVPAWTILAALLLLVVAYSVTNAVLWIAALPPSVEPGMFTHFGSIHSGRYANYAIFIAENDRVPYLSQNGGQAMLASAHLLLGVDSPLAALMVWIPFSLAFLTLLLFAVFRSGGFTVAPCMAATFLVMFCNIAVSTVHVLLFDNGSPLGFIGYTDMIVAVATFLLLSRWFQEQLVREESHSRAQLLLPALLGMTWCWYAPQNVVIAAAGCAATAMFWMWKHPAVRLRRRLGEAALVFALAVGIGAIQFGSFLPKSLREDTGLWTQEAVQYTVTIRPYIQYLRNVWTAPRWNTEVELGLYENTYAQARPNGPAQVYRSLAWILEVNLWDSIRIYGFPLLGLVLMGAYLRRVPPDDLRERSMAWQAWLVMSLCSFGFGYIIYFGVELGHMKWWLSRFLVPGSAMALTCLGFAALAVLGGLGHVTRRALWALLLVAATFGPVTELLAVGFRSLVIAAQADPIGRRLDALARIKGPFIFEALLFHAEAATQDARGFYIVGGDGRRQGLALYSRPMTMRPGKYRIGVRVDLTGQATGESPLMDLDVAVDGSNVIVARRTVRSGDLERRPDGYWTWLDFELARTAKDAQFRLSSRSNAVFTVTDARLRRP